MEPWQKLPLEHLRDIHELELYAGQHHRPVYTWFRSFGRRPGSLVRFLLLASLTDSSVQSSDILEYDESTGWDGLYLDEQPLEYVDATVIDPMLGSGSTVFEGSRLGLDVMGFEYNPVMWWVVRQTARNPGRQLEEDFAEFQSEVQEEVGGLFGNDGDETVLSYFRTHYPLPHLS